MKVKICGLTTESAVKAAVKYGADAIGFVFAPSKRRILKEEAMLLSRFVPKNVLKVGVFVNETKDIIEEIARDVSLDIIQLHGDESPAFLHSLSRPAIKAFSVSSVEDVRAAINYPADTILLDAKGDKYRGGHGTVFDWNILHSLKGQRFILAGGLSVENIEQAKKEVDPYWVDVSSGVETNGIKDSQKIRQFLQLAKGGCHDEK
ncbi:N-(5'-phosphoribosyl)anthranilate isomerase [Bacillus coahuilensis p1.1.43]|uniref:N-(5'-phosphoribosyl)anthranilate isomerase n=1 Tax=Bacillus coahuilensis p1.1.43 TaxID=1150625 RepID=A0A147K8D1_9BACI|nr:phosphoribosylanthranilate isomerase [Bacillus coahuilensis]KUP06434.1 N-(5'-phosphoribosyl)anthranilate isomerase [Bacillus coahuilensis p1.1.43]